MKILSFGEIIWDTYPDKRCIGGAPLNFAAHTVKSGATAYLLSAVGDDEAGEAAKKEMEKFGVQTDYIGVVAGKQTGKCNVTLDENGIPTYDLLNNVSYDYIPFAKKLQKERFDAVAFGTLALRSEFNRTTLKKLLEENRCGKVYCDLNLRAPFYDRPLVEFCFSSAHILKLNEGEIAYATKEFFLTGKDIFQQVRSLVKAFKNLQTVVVTLGEKGAFAYEQAGDKITTVQPVPVKPVSTVGAGDSFGASFLVAYLQGETTERCLKKAAARSAFVVAHDGAIPDGVEDPV